jgi:hypothetical protein
MKHLLLLFLFISTLGYSQYYPMTVHYNDSTTIAVIPSNCYDGTAEIYGYIQGGQRPYYYKWTYISNNNTVVQDSTVPTIVPGHDYLFDHLDHFDVSLNSPQPRLFTSLNWTGQWKLTVIDSRVESATDKHDTLNFTISYKWPDQMILPMYVTPEPSTYTISGLPISAKYNGGLPTCDTCPGEYLQIKPQRGTPPYNILLIGQDNLGNDVEYYGYQCMGLYITNLAQLYAGCYDIYVEDGGGCSEVFNYCYTTTGIEELTLERKVIKITDIMGKECFPEPNKLLIYHYSDNSTDKVFVSGI